jgi:hypothetical protein
MLEIIIKKMKKNSSKKTKVMKILVLAIAMNAGKAIFEK